MAGIHLFSEKTTYKLNQVARRKRWIKSIIQAANHRLQELNFIFCSDEYLLEVNKNYLQHDYYTDIITFDTSEKEEMIAGDIFISIDRVKDNAESLKIPFDTELNRVLIHGVLHLLGYSDKSPKDKAKMTAKEDEALALLAAIK